MKINSLTQPKLLIFILLLSCGSQLFSQKPREGDWLTEIAISFPFSGGNQYFYNSNVTSYSNNFYAMPVNNLGLNTRYFKKPNLVYRTGLNFGTSNYHNSLWNFNGAYAFSVKQSYNNGNLSFGIEKHLRTSASKFSPFCLAAVNIGYNGVRGKHTTDTLAIGGNWGSWNGYTAYTSKQNTINAGIIGLLGFDYWITSEIYIGLEYGVNFNFMHSGSTESTMVRLTNNYVDTEKVKTVKPYNNFHFGNYSNPFIRLGWRFYKSARLSG